MAKKENKSKLKPNTRYIVDYKKVLDLKDVIAVLESMYFFVRTNEEGEVHEQHKSIVGLLKEE